MGAAVAFAVIFVFSLVAGLEVGAIPVVATLAIFFVSSALYLNSQEKRYRKAVTTELERLKNSE